MAKIQKEKINNRHCDYCGNYYEGYGKKYCSPKCQNEARADASTEVNQRLKAQFRMTDEDKFWSKVNKTESCWLWTGAKSTHGYGHFVYVVKENGKSKRKYRLAHRFSYGLHNGEFDEKLHVCHRCDNPSCVNPNHLFLGTRKVNMKDASDKGRFPTSLKHHNAKLSDKDVIEIKRLRAEQGLLYREIAEKFGVSEGHIGAIIRGVWRDRN